ncbi:HTH domain-containing protein [Streptomyces sp. NBC_01717]|uniref:HTH domain-containing protein n=1 Tax=Streptomyces sp. NBC_01717 TaxID=2975918 RepID=UPI002E2FF92D|nr:HTH domain-containing protein [Streptomyces sp. NBC_01717]
MTDHEQQQSAPTRGKILDALTRAERATFTRPAPKSATAQVKYLLTRMKDSTKDLAERLGVSRRTVERYRAGQIKTRQKKLQAARSLTAHSLIRSRSAPEWAQSWRG